MQRNSNEKEIHEMENISKIRFVIELLSFLKQSIRGAYLPVYSMFDKKDAEKKSKNIDEIFSTLKKNTLVFELLENYINTCWFSYIKKTDEFVEKKFDLMLNFSKMKHIYCLFDLIWFFTKIINEKLLIKINKESLLSFNIFKEFLNKNLDHLMSEEIENLNMFDFTCEEKCKILTFEENISFTDSKK